MAFILKSDGTKVKNVKTSVKKLRAAVGGWLDICHTIDGRIMIVNEDGMRNNLPYNFEATKLHINGETNPIMGDVVICETNELNRS